MPQVSSNILKGNYGSAVVMSRLSSECLVRPVSADTDIGVDLYCETVTDGEPFLHFWVQVKSGESKCKQDPSGENASYSFKNQDLEYWRRQPVPVFAALVPTEWPVQGEPDVYIVDITSKLISEGVLSGSEKTLCSDYRWKPGDRNSVRDFLSQVVPAITGRLQISKGVVGHAPTPTPQYVRTFPTTTIFKHQNEILNQLRTTAAFGIIHPYLELAEIGLTDNYRNVLSHIVRGFISVHSETHWENFLASAISYHIDMEFIEAGDMYKKSWECIEQDVNVCDIPSWITLAERSKKLEKAAKESIPWEKARDQILGDVKTPDYLSSPGPQGPQKMLDLIEGAIGTTGCGPPPPMPPKS